MTTNLTITDQKIINDFEARTLMHIGLVNSYSRKFHEAFPNHDADKLTTLRDGYIYTAVENRTPEQEQALSDACRKHITTNKHHPEYWTHDELNIDRLQSKSVQLRNCIRAYDMPKDAIFEMCCDWCAMSEELGNSPRDWADRQIGTRWDFTPEQVKWIYHYLDALWD